MRSFKKSILSMLLIIAIVLSTVVPVYGATTTNGQPQTYSKQYNSGQRDVVCTTLDGTSASSYYTGTYTYEYLSTQGKDAIFKSLQTLMRNTATKTSSYDDCHYKADKTDCENEDGRVSLIYTSYSATMSQWNGWNREHVWPQSLGGGNTSGGGADLHHIRPSDASVNSTRGNKKFGDLNGAGTAKYGSNPATGALGGYYNSTYFEPLDNVKGDIARICLYVWVRWNSNWGADSVTEVFQSIDVLLEWCELDPVDTWEMGRNEVVQAIQGNRNVFIDYPEYAWLVFGREVPTDMQTPSGAAKGGACEHENVEVRNASEADCTDTGYTGDTYCLDCGKVITVGTVISANGHTYSEWVEIDGDKTRYCTVCDYVETTCMHIETVTRGKTEPNCTESGYTGDVYCLKCSARIEIGTVINASGHDWSDWTEEDSINTRSCSVCNTVESYCLHRETTLLYAKPATCTEPGYTGDTYCNKCNSELNHGAVINASGHDWSDWTDAEDYKVRICESCQEKEYGDCLHKTTEIRNQRDTTCTTNGYTGDAYCVVCGNQMASGKELFAPGHIMTEWTEIDGYNVRECENCDYAESECLHRTTEVRGSKDPTCDTQGYTGTTYCASCGKELYRGDSIRALGHDWTAWSGEGEFLTRTCLNCEKTESKENPNYCAHANTEIRNSVTPDCTKTGYTGDTYCLDCKKKLESGTELGLGDHDWSNWDMVDGVYVRICDTCGEEEVDAGECLHTNTEIRGAVSATCGSMGYTGDKYCKDCDEKLEKGKNISATNAHSWSDPSFKDGTDSYGHTCLDCGAWEALEYTEAEWGSFCENDAELIIATVTKNAFANLVLGLLTRS